MSKQTQARVDTELARYMRELRQYSIPKGEDFNELMNRWRKNGDRRAYDLLFYGNARLVASVATKYAWLGVPIADLMQEGMVGLARALADHDPVRGAFSTYAIRWIRQAIVRAIDNESPDTPFRLPVYMKWALILAKRAIRKFAEEYGREPGEEELYDFIKAKYDSKIAFDLKRKALSRCLQLLLYRFEVLDASRNRDETDQTGHESVADENIVLTDEIPMVMPSTVARLQRLIAVRKPRNWEVLQQRLVDGKTLQAVGDNMGFSRERARQIQRNEMKFLLEATGMSFDELLLAILTLCRDRLKKRQNDRAEFKLRSSENEPISRPSRPTRPVTLPVQFAGSETKEPTTGKKGYVTARKAFLRHVTYRQVCEAMAKHASTVTGVKVVRGAPLVLMFLLDASLWELDVEMMLQKLEQRQYITKCGGDWRSVELQYDSGHSGLDDRMFQ